MEQEIKQCGLCARWTHDGDDVPSGNRDLSQRLLAFEERDGIRQRFDYDTSN